MCKLYSSCFLKAWGGSKDGERWREKVEQKAKGGQEEKERRGAPVYLPHVLQANQVSGAPRWAIPEKLARLLSNRSSSSLSFSSRMAAINTRSECARRRENTPKMTTPRATAHGTRTDRGRRKERETKTERAREVHQRGGFIKVQVQNLSDCQAALSFWFRINVVSFLPPLSSSAPLRSSPCSAVCSFLSAPLSPRVYPRHRCTGKFGRNEEAWSNTAFFLFSL